MFDPPDYSILEGTEAAYRGFFPERRRTPPPEAAQDVMVPVAAGVEIGCRFHPGEPAGPNLLYFHGNGETVPDYDDIAPLFTRMGFNLLVADYRGYGFSGGEPSFPSMLQDAHAILAAFRDLLRQYGLAGPLFVMGRSMGGHSAVELAAHYPDALAGLMLESSAPMIGRLTESLEAAGRQAEATELEARHLQKVRAIAIPVLQLHGEWDDLIPIARAVAFFDALTVPRKRLERIPRAGHNDILWAGMEQYLQAVRDFVTATGG